MLDEALLSLLLPSRRVGTYQEISFSAALGCTFARVIPGMAYTDWLEKSSTSLNFPTNARVVDEDLQARPMEPTMPAALIPNAIKIGSTVESRGVLSSPQHRYGLTQSASTVSVEEGRAEAMAAPEMNRESTVENIIVFIGKVVLFEKIDGGMRKRPWSLSLLVYWIEDVLGIHLKGFLFGFYIGG